MSPKPKYRLKKHFKPEKQLNRQQVVQLIIKLFICNLENMTSDTITHDNSLLQSLSQLYCKLAK